MKKTLRIICLSIVAGLPVAAAAQEYPAKPVKIIVPFLAGGPNDVVGRLVARELGAALNGSFIVENVAGAGGRQGIGALAKAAPDGYTLGITANAPMAIAPNLYNKIPYDPINSFEHIALVAAGTLAISVNPKVAAKTIGEFVTLAKSRPGELSYGSPGAGSLPHLAAELFQSVTGTKLRHVPYRGGSAVTQDLLAGHIEASFETPLAAAGFHNKGMMRILAILDSQRFPSLPQVPTAGQEGINGVEVSFWAGVLAPSGTPAPVLAKLSSGIEAMLKKPDVIESLTKLGLRPNFHNSAAFRSEIEKETRVWAEIVAKAGIAKQ